jgi:hypothetical protein
MPDHGFCRNKKEQPIAERKAEVPAAFGSN